MLNQKGMASVEMIPILMMFIVLVNFGLGFFGVIHSGILNSIAARNYAFETFRNRANLNYLRDTSTSDPVFYGNKGFRYHFVHAEGDKRSLAVATKRPIKFTEVVTPTDALGSADDHNKKVKSIKDTGAVSEVFTGKNKVDGDAGVSPVWIMTSYGICLRASCAEQ